MGYEGVGVPLVLPDGDTVPGRLTEAPVQATICDVAGDRRAMVVCCSGA